MRTVAPRRRGLPVALLLVAFAVPALAQTPPDPSRSRFLRWAYQDAGALVGQADGNTLLYALGGTALLVPLAPFDDNINPRVQTHLYQGRFGAFLDFVNELGGPKATVPVAGLFAFTLFSDDARLQDAAFTSLQSLAYANVASYALKFSIGRARPYEQEGALAFSPFSGRSSFPSGHTVTAFAILTPWILYYPGPVTYGLFAVSAGTAVARLARDKHWATDVLAGGTLGFLTAYYLTKRHQGHAPRLRLYPSAGPESMSMTVLVRL